jgi:hypothetical protein
VRDVQPAVDVACRKHLILQKDLALDSDRGLFGSGEPFENCGSSSGRLIMPTAEEYRRYAKLCERLAAESSEKQEKAILRQIATQWRRLANLKIKRLAGQKTKSE